MKQFKWVVEFTVDETWVEDGFELTEERAKDMIENELQFSMAPETKVKILSAPDKKAIRKCQGYKD